jgi:hypothetical protein
VRQKLDAWLRDGGTIRIVPIGAFAVAVLLGIIPMWLEFGTFPRWAPREKVGAPLLVAWIAIFLAAEATRRYLARRSARRWESQLRDLELERADRLAGAIDRICASLIPQGKGRLGPDHIQASLLQGIVDAVRAMGIGPEVTLNASLLVPETRREGGQQGRVLTIISMNRLAERRGWASFKVDVPGPAQDTWRDGHFRAVPDTAAEGLHTIFTGPYRSIVTLPVMLRCMGGRRLAIVSVDASEPGIFTDEFVRSQLEQAVGPQIKLIALSLLIARRNLSRGRPGG